MFPGKPDADEQGGEQGAYLQTALVGAQIDATFFGCEGLSVYSDPI